jgi:hypothetical protein
MKKQLVIIGIVALLLIVGLSGCNQISNPFTSEKDKFVGTWRNTTKNITRTISLFSDGNCTFSTLNGTWDLKNLTGTWDLKNGTFIMKFPDSHLTYPFYYVFSDNDRTLSLSSAVGSSTPMVFTKQ